MKTKLYQRMTALLLCTVLVASVLSFVPFPVSADTPATTGDGSFIVPFFEGGSAAEATFTGDSVTCTNPSGLIDNGHGQYVGFDRVPYLQTGRLNVGDEITLSGLTGIPSGTYKVDLVAKSSTSRGIVTVKLDDTAFEPEIDMTNTANAENVDSVLSSNSQWAWSLTDSLVITGGEQTAHTVKLTVTGAGQCMAYGLRFTPVGSDTTPETQVPDPSEPFVFAFFQGTSKDAATFVGDSVTCTNPDGLTDNGHGQSVGFDRVPYLQTGTLNVGDVITLSGLTGIPYGTYKVDLVAKSGSGRGAVKVELDGIEFEPEIDMNVTANTESVDAVLGSNNQRAWNLTDSFSVASAATTPHTVKFTVTGAGQCIAYGLRFTPVGDPPVLPSESSVTLDKVAFDATGLTGTISLTLQSEFDNVTCISSDEGIVAVQDCSREAITLRPVSVGNTTVTVTATHQTIAGVSYSLELPVRVVDSGVTMDHPYVAMDLQGASKTREVSVTADPRFAIEEWISDRTDIVAVEGNGPAATLTCLGEGTATVTVRASYLDAVRYASMTVKVVDGALTFADAPLSADAFELREDIAVDDIRFNNLEWTGLTVDGVRMSDVFEVNRVAPHANLLAYQSLEAALRGAQAYDREASDYYMSLTTEEDLDPTTSDWKFAITDSLTVNAAYDFKSTVADPYVAGQDLRDFYQLDYDVSAWPGIAVPINWNLQGVGEDGVPYTGYYDAEYGYDPPYYINTASPKYVTVDGVRRNIYSGVSAPFAPWDYNPVGFYRTTFSVPQAWMENENKVFLNFGGVEAVFYVYLNGKEVGYHEDGKTLGEFDITPFLTADGQDNVLAVKVLRWSDGAWLDNQDMIRLGGIFREVYLTATPAVHVQDYKVETTLDDTFTNATLKLDAQIMNYTTDLDISDYQVVARVIDPEGNDILLGDNLILNLSEGTTDGHAVTVSGEVTVHAPHLWYPDDPYLYTLVLSLVDPDTGAVEHISQQLGFREITYRAEDDNNQWEIIRINGKKITVYGVNYADTTPDGGHYVSPEAYERDVQIMKQNNFNAVRSAYAPKDPYFLYLADRYGLMVIQEANNEAHPLRATTDVRDHFSDMFYSRMENTVESEKNRTSIIMWSIGNECGRQENMMYEMLKRFRELDTTRPYHYEQLHETVYDNGDIDYSADVRGAMYFNPEGYLARCLHPNVYRSFFMCEFAHATGNALGHVADFADAFRRAELAMGGCIWDFVNQSVWTTMTEADRAILEWDLYADQGRSGQYLGIGGDWLDGGETNNAGTSEGIVDALRQPEPELIHAKKAFQPLHFVASEADLLNRTVHVRNEYYATNASVFEYTWYVYENGSLYASGSFDVPDMPAFDRAYDVVYDIPTVALHVPYTLPTTLRVGAEYFLKIEVTTRHATDWAEAGHVIAWEQFELPVETGEVEAPVISGDVTVTESAQGYTVSGEDFSMFFGKTDGRMTNYTVGGELLLSEGPMPQFDRLQSRRDSWSSDPIKVSELLDIQSKLQTPEITVRDAVGQSYATVTVRYPVNVSEESVITMTYRIYANGAVSVTMDLDTPLRHNLYRFGVDMEMPVGFTDMEYYARGPQDNFVDRLCGTDIGRYTTTVAENFFPFVHNEHTGDHQEARWMALHGADKSVGLVFTATDGLMAVNALHISLEELSQDHVAGDIRQTYGHPFQLNNDPLKKTTFVSLSGATRGAGGGQNGVLEQYRVISGDLSFSFTMIPYTDDQSIQDVADPYRRALPITEPEEEDTTTAPPDGGDTEPDSGTTTVAPDGGDSTTTEPADDPADGSTTTEPADDPADGSTTTDPDDDPATGNTTTEPADDSITTAQPATDPVGGADDESGCGSSGCGSTLGVSMLSLLLMALAAAWIRKKTD